MARDRTPSAPPAGPDYHTWRQRVATIGTDRVPLATKPGLLGHGREDVASTLLARTVSVPAGATVVQLHCGPALCAIVAARHHPSAQVWCTDRSVVAVEAAQRSVALNALTTVTVVAGHGSAGLDPALRADVVAIRIPTEKMAVVQLLADAFHLLTVGGRLTIAGATNEGIKSAATLMQSLFGNATVLAHDSGHRAVMAIRRTDQPVDPSVIASAFVAHDAFFTMDVTLRGMPLRLFSRPGVFSWEHPDEATELLAGLMPVAAGDDVLDLGCGSGALGVVAARLSGTGRVRLVDVDTEAIRCATGAIITAGLTNAAAVTSDVASAVRDERFDVVVSNPPFHVGKATDLDVPAQFILDAWQVLRPGGRLALVANRTLPYERLVQDRFGNLTTLHDGPRFKVLLARR